MNENTITCETCGGTIRIGDNPFCHGDPHNHQPYRNTVIEDSIPGGILIEHGLCNADGSPRRYYSKSEIAAEAKRRGLENVVRHIDGSPHTTRWI